MCALAVGMACRPGLRPALRATRPAPARLAAGAAGRRRPVVAPQARCASCGARYLLYAVNFLMVVLT